MCRGSRPQSSQSYKECYPSSLQSGGGGRSSSHKRRYAMKRRVVVTGAGMVTPLGIGVEKSWEALCRGQSGIGPITRFDATPLKCQVAGEIKDFHPEDFMNSKFIRRFDPFIQYALAAAIMAVEDSGIKVEASNGDRVGVIMGTAVGGWTSFEASQVFVSRGELGKGAPFFILNATPNSAAGVIAIQFGAKGAP